MKHRRVLVFGAFDIFHPGHRSFFRQAKKHGTQLIVAVGRDQIIKRLKKYPTRNPEPSRLDRVKAEPLVNRALLAPRDPRRRFSFIRRLNPHVIALGYDQTHYTQTLAADLKKRGIKAMIVRLKPHRPDRYKGSILRRKKS